MIVDTNSNVSSRLLFLPSKTRVMNTIKTLIIVALIGSIQIVQAQDDNPDLYDIAGEFAFVRIQYDSYYDGGWYGGPGPLTSLLPMKIS